MNEHLSRNSLPLLLVVLLLPLATSGWSDQWVWQANDHTQNSTYFADRKTSLTVTEQGANWLWDTPCAGTVTIADAGDEPMGNDIGNWAQAVTDDFGEAWDLNKGVTFVVRAKPLNETARFSLCVRVKNSSTKGLPGNSAHIYAGWAVPGVMKMYDNPGRSLRVSVMNIAKYLESEWFTLTVGARRIGDTVAWDAWINGDHQSPDRPAPDGSLHTLVYVVKDASEVPGRTRLEIGMRHRDLCMRNVALDYAAITNDGVIPAWDGGTACAHVASPVDAAQSITPDAVALIKRIDGLVEQNNYGEAEDACNNAYENHLVGDSARAKEALVFFKSVIAKAKISECVALAKSGKYDDAIAECKRGLLKRANLPKRYVAELVGVEVSALRHEGRVDEAVQTIKEYTDAFSSPEQVSRLRYLIGAVYMEGKRYAYAVGAFLDALSVPASRELRAQCTYNLAMCYREMGQKESATRYLNQVISLYGSTEWAKRATAKAAIWAR